MLEVENDWTREKAEQAAIEWAKTEYGVTLVVIECAEESLPLSNLVGRVLWPVPSREVKLSDDDVIDALMQVAMRTRKKYESRLTEQEADAFEDAVLARLAAKHGITIP